MNSSSASFEICIEELYLDSSCVARSANVPFGHRLLQSPALPSVSRSRPHRRRSRKIMLSKIFKILLKHCENMSPQEEVDEDSPPLPSKRPRQKRRKNNIERGNWQTGSERGSQMDGLYFYNSLLKVLTPIHLIDILALRRCNAGGWQCGQQWRHGGQFARLQQ